MRLSYFSAICLLGLIIVFLSAPTIANQNQNQNQEQNEVVSEQKEKVRVHQFGCYAPPLVYGPWCSTGLGIVGKASVQISVEPVGDTTLFCKINCCGQIAEFVDTITCSWNCAGTPEISCKGNPLGSAVTGYQY